MLTVARVLRERQGKRGTVPSVLLKSSTRLRHWEDFSNAPDRICRLRKILNLRIGLSWKMNPNEVNVCGNDLGCPTAILVEGWNSETSCQALAVFPSLSCSPTEARRHETPEDKTGEGGGSWPGANFSWRAKRTSADGPMSERRHHIRIPSE